MSYLFQQLDVSNGLIDPAYQWDDEQYPWEICQEAIKEEQIEKALIRFYRQQDKTYSEEQKIMTKIYEYQEAA